jgi:hypothetical protein
MRRIFVMIGVVMSALCGAGVAQADDADATFKEYVTKLASSESQYVESWWTANLDADPALERVAVLCPTDKEDHKGYFLIEKDPSHRWEITFDFDSRTKACKAKPAAPPTLEKRKTNTVDLYQGHLQGYELTAYALRIGQPVIVREEQVETEGGKPTVTDWDALIKKKKAKSYQVPETLRQLNN